MVKQPKRFVMLVSSIATEKISYTASSTVKQPRRFVMLVSSIATGKVSYTVSSIVKRRFPIPLSSIVKQQRRFPVPLHR